MRKKLLIPVPIAAALLLGWWLAPPTPTVEAQPLRSVPVAPAPVADPTPRAAAPVRVDEVECPFEAPHRLGPVTLTELDPDTLEARGGRPLRFDGDVFRFRPDDAELGAARLQGPDLVRPVHVVWAAGVCTELVRFEPRPRFDATVVVDGPVGPDTFLYVECWNPPRGIHGTTVAVEGGVAHLDYVIGQHCHVGLKRHHGSITVGTDGVPLAVTTEPQELTLPPPALPRTGLGAYTSQGSVVVDAIEPGSRGDSAGLELRDRLWPEAPVEDLEAWLDDAEPIWVEVERDGERFEVWL